MHGDKGVAPVRPGDHDPRPRVQHVEGRVVVVGPVYQLPAGRGRSPRGHSLCSDMAAWGAATAGGRLIHGANYDYSTFNVLHRWTGVVVARPDRGHAFIAQCIPGRVGYYRGMNETGIIATEKTSQSADRNMREHPRIPHSMHMRALIQHASTLAEAVDIMGRLLGTTGNNNLVSDAKVASALEIQGSCTKTAVFHPEKGMDAYWNTNQYLAYPGYRGYRGVDLARDQLHWFGVPPGEADTVEKWVEAMRRESAKRTFSWQRFERMGELVRERYGRIDVPAVIDILSAPPLCRETEGRQTLAPECEQLFGEKGPIVDFRLSSIFSVVFDAGDMTAHVAVGAEPAQRGRYWPLSFPVFRRALQAIRDEGLTGDSDAGRKDAMLSEAFSRGPSWGRHGVKTSALDNSMKSCHDAHRSSPVRCS